MLLSLTGMVFHLSSMSPRFTMKVLCLGGTSTKLPPDQICSPGRSSVFSSVSMP